MAEVLKKLRAFRSTTAGTVLEAAAYAVMLVLTLMFFTGNGQFIYEGF